MAAVIVAAFDLSWSASCVHACGGVELEFGSRELGF
jgi:hypothetical protein